MDTRMHECVYRIIDIDIDVGHSVCRRCSDLMSSDRQTEMIPYCFWCGVSLSECVHVCVCECVSLFLLWLLMVSKALMVWCCLGWHRLYLPVRL